MLQLQPVHSLKSPAVTISFSFFCSRQKVRLIRFGMVVLASHVPIPNHGIASGMEHFLKIQLLLGDYKRKGKGKEGKTTHHLINQRSAKGRIAGYWLDNMSFCEPIYAV